MRSKLKIVSATVFVLVLAVGAHAVPFTGSVSFGLATLPPLTASGSGSGNSPGPISILTTAWASTGPVLITLSPTAAPPLTALNILLVGPGPCASLPGSCAMAGTANALVGGAPFLVVPLSGLGVAGRVGFGAYGSYIDAQAWQTGTVPVTINGVPLTTGAGGPIADFGYDARTPGGLGTVRLVAPAGLMSTLGGNLPLFVSMTLTFTPEPGTLLLLGSGILGLAILGRKRLRR
jgi:hypothetical protein